MRLFKFLTSILKSSRDLFAAVRLNKLIWVLLIAIGIILITIIFSFIAFAPALSPFIYPLL